MMVMVIEIVDFPENSAGSHVVFPALSMGSLYHLEALVVYLEHSGDSFDLSSWWGVSSVTMLTRMELGIRLRPWPCISLLSSL